jgi:5-methylcytosine-specific restriction protein A
MILEIGRQYQRQALYEEFGGEQQGGISIPAAHPVIFLFAGAFEKQHGYHFDGPKPDGTFWYTGEGRTADMTMSRGNVAIRDAVQRGRAIHLFEQAEPGWVRYLGQVAYLGHHHAIAPDRDGDLRRVIVFQLALVNEFPDATQQAEPLSPQLIDALWDRPIEEVRSAALATTSAQPTAQERRDNAYLRSEAIKIYARRRAAGRCEGCRQPAPFTGHDGRPYLEVHHIMRLADGGPDHPAWVAALCPNCHAHIHHGDDGADRNENLRNHIAALENQAWPAA